MSGNQKETPQDALFCEKPSKQYHHKKFTRNVSNNNYNHMSRVVVTVICLFTVRTYGTILVP